MVKNTNKKKKKKRMFRQKPKIHKVYNKTETSTYLLGPLLKEALECEIKD